MTMFDTDVQETFVAEDYDAGLYFVIEADGTIEVFDRTIVPGSQFVFRGKLADLVVGQLL